MSDKFHDLRVEIVRNFRTQSDFAGQLGICESKISQVLRGRKRLTPAEADRWRSVLHCPPELLKPVTRV
jgi:plasmid maintenance system antidote protein VapI